MKSALELSKYIIGFCAGDNMPISNLQLQKILYYIQCEFLKKNKEAFPDDFEAWQFGPVVPSVYRQYCGFGARSIKMTYNIALEEELLEDQNLINRIIRINRVKNPWDLVRETHQKGKAWNIIYSKYGNSREIIPKELMKRLG